jgi:hypothetical protein
VSDYVVKDHSWAETFSRGMESPMSEERCREAD